MTTELWMLLWTALWAIAIPYAYVIPRLRVGGIAWGIGNRDTVPETDPWVQRAERAHRNMVEQLGPFAIIVLVAHVSGTHNPLTAYGSMLYFACRVLHTVSYILGLVWVRSVVFYLGIAAELTIVLQILLARLS